MIQHIDVRAVLQESVSGMYADLVTRPTGRVVRERIERAIARPADRVVVARMDFRGVRCIDFSCADEIVAKLLGAGPPGPLGPPGPPVLVLSGLSEAHREAIEPVLARRGLAALVEGADGTLDALGAAGAAAALVEALVARRLAARTAGGTVALTLA